MGEVINILCPFCRIPTRVYMPTPFVPSARCQSCGVRLEREEILAAMDRLAAATQANQGGLVHVQGDSVRHP